MDEERTNVSDKTRRAVIELLRSRSKKARFITEVAASLQGSKVSAEEVERALSDLEAEGLVMIRDHYCADPHLVGVDLRVVAFVYRAEGEDPETTAIREIDSAWDKWLADYLSNHRCG
jgi:hypothetical protein